MTAVSGPFPPAGGPRERPGGPGGQGPGPPLDRAAAPGMPGSAARLISDMTKTPELLRYTAFSTDPSGGNPAGVVLDASGLDAAARALAGKPGRPLPRAAPMSTAASWSIPG